MSNQAKLIERALRLPHVEGKGHLARMLDIDHSALNQVIKGQRNFTAKQAILLAEVIGQPAMDILALCQEDAARNSREREWWARRAPRLLASIAWAGIAAGIMLQPRPALAGHVIQSGGLALHAIHYAKLLRRLKARFRRFAVEGLHSISLIYASVDNPAKV